MTVLLTISVILILGMLVCVWHYLSQKPKFYVTFGQIHKHDVNGKHFDKDCVAVIRADDYENARTIAFQLFKGVFFTVYESPPPMKYFPRGFIELGRNV